MLRPVSAASKCCVFDMVPVEHTGPPRFFVSHAWSRPLKELLGLLRSHLDDAAEALNVLVWIDIMVRHAAVLRPCVGPTSLCLAGHATRPITGFVLLQAINQHPYENRGALHDTDLTGIAQVVAATERTLFCLDEDCTSLTRIWCLYEVCNAAAHANLRAAKQQSVADK